MKAKAAKIAEDRRKREDAKRAEAQRLVDVYRGSEPHKHTEAQKLVDIMVLRGVSDHVDLEDSSPSAFIVYRRQWQAAIFDRLFKGDYDHAVTAYDIAKGWKERWTKPELRYVKAEHSRWIAKEVAEDFRSPYEEIAACLERLKRAGVVQRTARVGAYYMEYRFKEGIKAVIAREELPGKRRGQLAAAVKAIADLMQPYDGRLEGFDSWLKKAGERVWQDGSHTVVQRRC